MKLNIQTLDAKAAGSIDLDDAIFGITEIRADILQRMVKYQLAKRRAGTHKTQSRGEVSVTHSRSISKRARAKRVTARRTLRSFAAVVTRTIGCRATTRTI